MTDVSKNTYVVKDFSFEFEKITSSNFFAFSYSIFILSLFGLFISLILQLLLSIFLQQRISISALKYSDAIAKNKSKHLPIFTLVEPQQRFLFGDIMYAKNSKVKPKYAEVVFNNIDNSNLEQFHLKIDTSVIKAINVTKENSDVIGIQKEILRRK